VKLSVGIITHNEERMIGKTLNAVKGIADEMIVVDSYSRDKTVEIAKSLGATVYSEKWQGFGPQKNSLLDKCTGDWVLLIDADEVVSPELAARIKQIVHDDIKDRYKIYEINLCSVCFGKKLKHGGWSNDYHIRLWQKDMVRFDDRSVHEGMIPKDRVGVIREKIYHYTYLTLTDYLTKFNNYTTLGAQEYYRQKRKARILNIILNPSFTFINMYIVRAGFLDGIEGLTIASFSALSTMAKYFKLREMYKNRSYL
jgi:glycosyltransferase involved in cell wall biosynthesis